MPCIPPSRCSQCRGVWLPREAVESHRLPKAVDQAKDQPGQQKKDHPGQVDSQAGICPLCRGVLVRARVESDHPFHLDRCPVCSGIWFDAGEWAAIASTEWLDHLDDLWDPIWRKRVRERRAEKRHLETLHNALGDDAFRKVVQAVHALRKHPRRSLGLSFLIDELRGPGR